MGFLISKVDRGPAPDGKGSGKGSGGRRGEDVPDVIVHKPSCRDEAYLSVQGGLKWDREHLAQWEAAA